MDAKKYIQMQEERD